MKFTSAIAFLAFGTIIAHGETITNTGEVRDDYASLRSSSVSTTGATSYTSARTSNAAETQYVPRDGTTSITGTTSYTTTRGAYAPETQSVTQDGTNNYLDVDSDLAYRGGKGSKSAKPSAMPSSSPSFQPSFLPSATPSTKPSATPSALPSALPSAAPSSGPTTTPSSAPSAVPTSFADACCTCDGEITYTLNPQLATYATHVMNARAIGCELASITSAEEQLALEAALDTANQIDFGLAGDEQCVYIGLQRPHLTSPTFAGDAAEGWDWTDDCEMFDETVYDNWDAISPILPFGTVACAFYPYNDVDTGIAFGTWIDISEGSLQPAVYECCLPARSAETCDYQGGAMLDMAFL